MDLRTRLGVLLLAIASLTVETQLLAQPADEGHEALVKRLLAGLNSPQVDQRAATYREMVARIEHEQADWKDPRLVEPLIARLKDEKDKGAPIDLLRILGDQRTVEPLIAASKDMEPGVRYIAILAVGSIGGPKAVAFLKDILQTGDMLRRPSAAMALGLTRDPAALDLLTQLLKDQAEPLWASAAWGLAQAGGEKAIQSLIAEAHGSRGWRRTAFTMAAIEGMKLPGGDGLMERERNSPEFRFEQETLERAIQFFGEQTSLSVVVDWWALKKAGVARTDKVTLKLADLKKDDEFRESPGGPPTSIPVERKPTLAAAFWATLSAASKPGVILTFHSITIPHQGRFVIVSTLEGLREWERFQPLYLGSAGPNSRPEGSVPANWWKHRAPEFRVDGIQLSDVVQFCRDLTRVKIDVDWDALGKLGVTKASLVKGNRKDMSAEMFLWLYFYETCGPGRVAYRVKDGTVIITAAPPGGGVATTRPVGRTK